MSEFSKRKKSEYAKAVAEAERETRFFVARQLKATVPAYRIKLDQDIAELQLAWRDMSDEEKEALKADTIRKARGFVRPGIAQTENAPGQTSHVDPAERRRQLEALYRAMNPEQRAEYERGAA